MSTSYSRTGARRQGDDYQDIVALDLFVEMLEHPNRFQWVQLEANDYGYLDDIVACRKDASIDAIQVKYSVHPDKEDDPYTWEDLLKQGEGKSGKVLPSLIQKWSASLQSISCNHNLHQACLVSNRRWNDSDGTRIDNEILDYNSIAGDVRSEIEVQIGSKDSAISFFKEFHFDLDKPNLDIMEEAVFKRFVQLGGTREGWLSLWHHVRQWVKRKDLPSAGGLIRLHDIRFAAQWYILQGLPQEFEIPSDFVLPSESFHNTVKARLSTLQGECIVISGTPGVGKSTYLSYLCNELKNDNQPIIRHHYFLSLDDRSVGQRFDHLKIIESLMHDLQEFYTDWVGNPEHNPAVNEFPQWLNKISESTQQRHVPFIIAIDGLDHVWRERHDIAELIHLFESLFPARPGINVLIGTQPLDDAQLPPILLRNAPRERWLALPNFDLSAVADWVSHHKSEMLEDRLPVTNEDMVDNLINSNAEAFFEVSEGHPLHLKYLLQSMRDQGITFSEDNIRKLSPCSHEGIRSYYENLWCGLGYSGKFALCLIAAGNFSWTEKGMLQALRLANFNPTEAMQEWKSIRYLLRNDELGWKPLHGSLSVFVREKVEYGANDSELKRVTLEWLERQAPSYWNWAFFWTLKAEWENPNLLLQGADRQWVIESLSKGYPVDDVQRIVSECAKRAFNAGDFTRFAERALLCDYIGNYYGFQQEDIFDRLRKPQLKLLEDRDLPTILRQQIASLSERELLSLAEFSVDKDDMRSTSKCLEYLQKALNHRGQDSAMLDQVDRFARALLSLPSYSSDSAEIIGNIRRNRKWQLGYHLPYAFASALRRERRLDLLIQCANSRLKNTEREPFFSEGVFLALETGGTSWHKLALKRPTNPYCAIYAALKGLGRFKFEAGYSLNWSLFERSEYELYQYQREIGHFYYECFFNLLAAYLHERQDCIDIITDRAQGEDWRWTFIRKLDSIASALTSRWRTSQPITIAWFYEQIKDVPKAADYPNDSDYYIGRSVRRGFLQIAFDCVLLFGNSTSHKFTREDINAVDDSIHMDIFEWLDEYCERSRCYLDSVALDCLHNTYGELPVSRVWRAAEQGAKEFAILASVFAIHDRAEISRYYIHRSVDLGIVHGWHKDVLIWDIIRSVRLIGDGRSDLAMKIIEELAPAIAEIREFTDGKETRNFPDDFGALLTEIAPEKITTFYLSYLKKEHYYRALEQFHNILKILDYTDEIHQSLARTAIDQESLDWMVEKVKDGDDNLALVLSAITHDLGGIAAKPERNRSETIEPDNLSQRDSIHSVDISDYRPEQLDEYIDALRASGTYEFDKKISLWVDYWINKTDITSVITAIQGITTKQPYMQLGKILFELTKQASGRDSAYPYLVDHCRNKSCWSRWSTESVEARNIWNTIFTEHSDKWLSFIVETLFDSKYSRGKVGIYHIFPRLIEYMVLGDHIEDAKAILTGIINTFSGLVAPFKLPAVEWINDPKSMPEAGIDILLSRLEWPSGMVRERAIHETAKLLAENTDNLFRQRFLNWAEGQIQESRLVLSLIVLSRTKELNPEFSLSTEEIEPILRYRSLLSDLLQLELTGKKVVRKDLKSYHSETAPVDYQPFREWEECLRSISPRIHDNVKTIGKGQEEFVTRQWAFETEVVINRGQYSFPSSAGDFWGRKDDEHHVGYVNNASEVMTSGYLRLLAWALENGIIRNDIATIWAIEALPIDLNLLSLCPRQTPHWWPNVQPQQASEIDLIPGKILSLLEQQLPLGEEDSHFGYFSGWVMDSGDMHYYCEVIGLFQACFGDDHPTADFVSNSIGHGKRQLYSPVTCRFRGRYDLRFGLDDSIQIQDWAVIRASSFLMPYAPLRFQGYRLAHGIWCPVQHMSQHPVSFRRSDESILFFDGDHEIGTWFDWVNGLRELEIANLPLRTGSVLFLKKQVVENLIRHNGGVLCWLCRIQTFHRKHSIGEFNEETITNLVGASRLIQPTQFTQ